MLSPCLRGYISKLTSFLIVANSSKRFTCYVGAFLDGHGRGKDSAGSHELQTPVVQLGREAEAYPLQRVREESVRDGREAGLGQLAVDTHAF